MLTFSNQNYHKRCSLISCVIFFIFTHNDIHDTFIILATLLETSNNLSSLTNVVSNNDKDVKGEYLEYTGH